MHEPIDRVEVRRVVVERPAPRARAPARACGSPAGCAREPRAAIGNRASGAARSSITASHSARGPREPHERRVELRVLAAERGQDRAAHPDAGRAADPRSSDRATSGACARRRRRRSPRADSASSGRTNGPRRAGIPASPPGPVPRSDPHQHGLGLIARGVAEQDRDQPELVRERLERRVPGRRGPPPRATPGARRATPPHDRGRALPARPRRDLRGDVGAARRQPVIDARSRRRAARRPPRSPRRRARSSRPRPSRRRRTAAARTARARQLDRRGCTGSRQVLVHGHAHWRTPGPDGDVRPMIEAMRELARRAVATGRHLFLWVSL